MAQESLPVTRFHVRPAVRDSLVELDVTVSFAGKARGRTQLRLPADRFGVHDMHRLATTSRDLPARVYLAVGSREGNNQRDMVADLRSFAATLEQRKYHGLRLRWSVEDDETHNSVFPGALSDGLRFVFSGQ